MKILVGLGNPGSKYEQTRHNAGFLALDELLMNYGFDSFKEVSKHKGWVTEGQIADERVILLKPNTYMNLSGQATAALAQYYKVEPSDIVVIHDEVDIASGTLKIKTSGSAGGHNGIKSVIQELGTDQFLRIRLGIAPLEPFKGELDAYVLGKMTTEEEQLLSENLERLPAVLETLFQHGAEKAMNEYH